MLFAASTPENVPAGHALQLSADVAPVNSRYVPAAHASHARISNTVPGAASDLACFPAAHGTHTSGESSPSAFRFGTYVPTGHFVQLSSEIDPVAFKNVPAGQSRHTSGDAAPTRPLYLPAGHASHASTLQCKFSRDVATGRNVPAGHAVQLSGDVAPVMLEYLPASQNSQSEISVCPLRSW